MSRAALTAASSRGSRGWMRLDDNRTPHAPAPVRRLSSPSSGGLTRQAAACIWIPEEHLSAAQVQSHEHGEIGYPGTCQQTCLSFCNITLNFDIDFFTPYQLRRRYLEPALLPRSCIDCNALLSFYKVTQRHSIQHTLRPRQ